MKVKKSDGSDFRVVLIGMITNSVVLSRISQQWSDDGLFGDRWCNRIGGWCLKYYRKYNEPPKSKIRDIFESWANRDPDNPMVEPIEKFLASLSDQYESADITPDYILDRAGEVFNKVRIRKLIEDVELKLDQDQSEAAYEQLVSLSKVQLGEGALVKVATDFDAWADAFHELEHNEVLIPYPRTLHNFFGQWLTRDSLYAVMASDKQGKSVILLDMAVRALRNRKRVAYFDTGDMSQRQVMRRLGTRVARIPISPTDVKFPRSVSHDGDVEFESRNFKKGLSLREAYRAINKASRGKDLLRVACYPNSTISVNGIQSVLQDWAREGWVADVCIAEGSLVLTDRGLVPIEKIKPVDKLWDGVNWVSHKGLVYKGVRDVITYEGITATPDHKVWTEFGWRSLESCRRMGLRIARTGIGRKNLRLSENYFSNGSDTILPIQKIRAGVSGETKVRVGSMYAMWLDEMGVTAQYPTRDCQRVSQLFDTKTVSNTFLSQGNECSTTVRQSKSPCVEALWGSRNRVSLQDSLGWMFMDNGKSRITRKGFGVGPNQQRWALRTGEFAMVHTKAESVAYPQTNDDFQSIPFSDFVSRCLLRRFNAESVFSKGVDSNADCREMEYSPEPMQKSPVWDVLSTGPFHRFTVQGLLVHNCIIDYADILADPPKSRDNLESIDDTWKQMRRLSQEMHCLVVTATQANAAAYGRKDKLLDKSNFSGRKTKLAHVNGMIGINTWPGDKKKGVIRLNWIVRREGIWDTGTWLTAAGCWSYYSPFVVVQDNTWEATEEEDDNG